MRLSEVDKKMKQTILIGLLALILCMPVALAQEGELPSAGITPSSKLYFIDVAIDKIRVALTRDPLEKAKLRIKIAEERLAEAEVESSKGNDYESRVAMAEHQEEMLGIEKEKEKMSEEQIQFIEQKLSKHLEILQKVKSRVPESAMAGIEHAINSSSKVMEHFRERIQNTVAKKVEVSANIQSQS